MSARQALIPVFLSTSPSTCLAEMILNAAPPSRASMVHAVASQDTVDMAMHIVELVVSQTAMLLPSAVNMPLQLARLVHSTHGKVHLLSYICLLTVLAARLLDSVVQLPTSVALDARVIA